MTNLFLFTGPELYLLTRHLKGWKDAFIEKHGEFNLSVFDAKETPLREMLAAMEAMPFLGDKRLVVIHGLPDAPKTSEKTTKKDEKREGELKNFQIQLKDLPSSAILVLVQANPDKRKSLYKFVMKEGELKEFKTPEGPALIKWIQQEAAEKGGKIGHQTADYLGMLVGKNLWKLSNEIAKLVHYANGNEITSSMIDRVSVSGFEADIFAFTDSLVAKNYQKAIHQLHRIVDAGENLHPVFHMLVRQIRLLLLGKDWITQSSPSDASGFASTLKVHPFVAKKTLEQARSFQSTQLKQAHATLLQIDEDLKNGRIRVSADSQDELALAMEQFILKVCEI